MYKPQYLSCSQVAEYGCQALVSLCTQTSPLATTGGAGGGNGNGDGSPTIAATLPLANNSSSNNNISNSVASGDTAVVPSRYLAGAGACEAVSAALQASPCHPGVAKQGLSAVCALCAAWPPNKALFGALNIGDAMVT